MTHPCRVALLFWLTCAPTAVVGQGLAQDSAHALAQVVSNDVVEATSVIEITGRQLAGLDGIPLDRLAVFACRQQGCAPIPFQIDEMTADGRWVLEGGPAPISDSPPGLFDGNDLVLWMAHDGGDRRAPRDGLPPHQVAVPVRVTDTNSGRVGWVYVVAFGAGPRPAASPTQYVTYDPVADLMRGRRIGLGFRDGVPDRLLPLTAAGDGANLLDRFKVRARAGLLWDLLHFTRSEDDLSAEALGWHRGPIRIIRYQEHRIRLGWGIRSPRFAFHTFFHPDFAEMPLGLWLNFPPTRYFTDIRVEVLLDFRDLAGWSFETPGRPPQVIEAGSATKERMSPAEGSWFAVRGPSLTLAQTLAVSDSLAPARRRLVYRQTGRSRPPESIPGERPAIGYRLDQWEAVGAGGHAIKAVAYALPADVDVAKFLAARGRYQVTVPSP